MAVAVFEKEIKMKELVVPKELPREEKTQKINNNNNKEPAVILFSP
jgi:hypothetical protein